MKYQNSFQAPIGVFRVRMGVTFVLLGLLVFLFGAKPEWFGLDRSPVIGFVQIAVFLVGLSMLCIGGYVSLDACWLGQRKGIAAEIGMRLVATGYVIALAAGMADAFGLGTRPLPDTPFFGYWQARGVFIGEGVIILGFLLMIPYTRWRKG